MKPNIFLAENHLQGQYNSGEHSKSSKEAKEKPMKHIFCSLKKKKKKKL